MTIEEAISRIQDVLNSEYRYDETLGYELTSDDFDWLEMAIAALRAKQELENPKPLTLDELREMDGEPVWIVSLESESDWMPQWCTFHDGYVHANLDTRDGEKYFFYPGNYRDTWFAYRHKPKEEL